MSIYKEDQYIKYDTNTHRYYITPSYIINSYGVNLSSLTAFKSDELDPSSAAQRFLKRLSLILYNFIYEYSNDKDILEYVIATKHSETMKEALGEFAYSFYLSGNEFSLETGLSLDNGKEMSKDDLMVQMIPPSVRMILDNSGLLFRGRLTGYDKQIIAKLKEEKEF